MDERPGDATMFGNPLTVLGPRLTVGEAAPDFALIDFDPRTFGMSVVSLRDLVGRTTLLNVVVSLDTPVCQIQTKRWHDEEKAIRGLQTLTVSKDLPFAQSRWKAAEGVTHRTLSAYRDDQFALHYGVLVQETHLLQRSLFLVGPEGRLQYVQYVREQTEQPDYEAAVEVAKRVVEGHAG